MHIQNADRNNAAFTAGCGRHYGAEAALTLRRRALPEVAASAAGQTPASPAVEGNPACAANAAVASRAPDGNTYDVSAMRREKGSVSILTQDGDTVQIRFRSTTGVAVTASSTSTADSATTTSSVYAFASGRMKVEVNGELDADELKAIGDLMEKVDSLASQFFDGDTQAAFSAAADLGFDAGEIAGFALRLSVKESVRATMQSPVAATETPSAPVQTAPTPAPAPDPAPAPAETPVSAPTVAETTPTDSTAVAPATPPAGTTDPAASLQQKLGSFLSQVLDALSGVSGAGRAEFSMKWKLQMMISAVQSVPAAPATASAPESAGTKLAAESLQSLASAQA